MKKTISLSMKKQTQLYFTDERKISIMTAEILYFLGGEYIITSTMKNQISDIALVDADFGSSGSLVSIFGS